MWLARMCVRVVRFEVRIKAFLLFLYFYCFYQMFLPVISRNTEEYIPERSRIGANGPDVRQGLAPLQRWNNTEEHTPESVPISAISRAVNSMRVTRLSLENISDRDIKFKAFNQNRTWFLSFQWIVCHLYLNCVLNYIYKLFILMCCLYLLSECHCIRIFSHILKLYNILLSFS